MNNTNINIPYPVNEPILDYAPESEERNSILTTYKKMYAKKSTVFLKINGKNKNFEVETFTWEKLDCQEDVKSTFGL